MQFMTRFDAQKNVTLNLTEKMIVETPTSIMEVMVNKIIQDYKVEKDLRDMEHICGPFMLADSAIQMGSPQERGETWKDVEKLADFIHNLIQEAKSWNCRLNPSPTKNEMEDFLELYYSPEVEEKKVEVKQKPLTQKELEQKLRPVGQALVNMMVGFRRAPASQKSEAYVAKYARLAAKKKDREEQAKKQVENMQTLISMGGQTRRLNPEEYQVAKKKEKEVMKALKLQRLARQDKEFKASIQETKKDLSQKGALQAQKYVEETTQQKKDLQEKVTFMNNLVQNLGL